MSKSNLQTSCPPHWQAPRQAPSPSQVSRASAESGLGLTQADANRLFNVGGALEAAGELQLRSEEAKKRYLREHLPRPSALSRCSLGLGCCQHGAPAFQFSNCSSATYCAETSSSGNKQKTDQVDEVDSDSSCDDKDAVGGKKGTNLKADAYGRASIMPFHELRQSPCGASCTSGRDCLNDSRFDYAYLLASMTSAVWGTPSEAAYGTKQRKVHLESAWITYGAHYSAENVLTFKIANKEGTIKRQICDSSFLILAGFTSSRNASDVSSRAYLDLKEKLKHPGQRSKKVPRYQVVSEQKTHVISYVRYLKKRYIGDTTPYAVGASEGEAKNVRVLPFDKLSTFFENYRMYCKKNGVREDKQAEKTCFEKTVKEMIRNQEIKLLGSKGTFPTCEVCNAAHRILRNSKFTPHQQQIVEMMLDVHLEQQQREREHKEEVKMRCLEVDDLGQPKAVFVYHDAMTSKKGETPNMHERGTRKDKEGKTITNRIFAVEVICIRSYIMYVSVDDTITAGANLAIEITRLALNTLSEELFKNGLEMPREIYFQYDNCGENKNKEMFCYAASLVELGLADIVNINFLIVGHTHDSLDQIFSVLCNAIDEARFILTPLGMRELIATAHAKESERPDFNFHLQYVYDWVKFFEDMVNTRYHFYNVPYRHRFVRAFGRCIYQYMFVSKPQSSSDDWMPRFPPDFSLHVMKTSKLAFPAASSTAPRLQLEQLKAPYLSFIGGPDALKEKLGIHHLDRAPSTSALRIALSFDEFSQEMQQQDQHLLARLLRNCDGQAKGRVYDEAEEADNVAWTEYNQRVQRMLTDASTVTSGFIIWLDFNKHATMDKLLSRPRLLPELQALTGVENSATKDTAKKAAHIANICKAQLVDSSAEGSFVTKISQGGTDETIRDATNGFKDRILSKQETKYLRSNSTATLVLENIKLVHQAILKRPFSLLERREVAMDVKLRRANDMLEGQKGAQRIASKLMVRNREAAHFQNVDGEIVTREGLLSGQLQKYNMGGTVIRCVVKGCNLGEGKLYACREGFCKAFLCFAHSSHSFHQLWVSDEAIAHQRGDSESDAFSPQSAGSLVCAKPTCVLPAICACTSCAAPVCAFHREHQKHSQEPQTITATMTQPQTATVNVQTAKPNRNRKPKATAVAGGAKPAPVTTRKEKRAKKDALIDAQLGSLGQNKEVAAQTQAGNKKRKTGDSEQQSNKTKRNKSSLRVQFMAFMEKIIDDESDKSETASETADD